MLPGSSSVHHLQLLVALVYLTDAQLKRPRAKERILLSNERAFMERKRV